MRWEILGTLILAVGTSIAWADELPSDTNSIQTLTVEQAEELVGRDSSGSLLELNGLKTLTPEIARTLAKHLGPLRLNGLGTISVETEKALAQHQGELQCRGLASLASAELAEKAWQDVGFRSFVVSYLRNISPEAAEVFAGKQDALSLDGLTEIPVEVAATLSKHVGLLSLNGLTTLSADAEKALAKHQGELRCSGLTSLASAELAARMWRDERFGTGQLIPLKKISPEAAAVFVGKDYYTLRFDDLTELPLELAKAFAKHKGELHLNGVTTLTPEVAKTLARHDGGLSLNGLSELSLEAAAALSKHEGNRSIAALKRQAGFSAEAAAIVAILTSREGDVLNCDGLTSLPQDAADPLSRHRGELRLNGLTSLTVEDAVPLARHDGVLSLSGLTTLTPEVADTLSRHNGDLRLNGLATLPPEVAEPLSRHKEELHLDGLTALSLDAAEILAQHRGLLSLKGLESQQAISVEAAALAAMLTGEDEFFTQTKNYSELTPHAAKALIIACRTRHREHYELNCDGLTQLTPEVAEVFAQYRGRLSFDGITDLTPEVARTLAKHEGELSLDGLTSLSPEAAEALATHGRDYTPLSLNGLTAISLQAAEKLAMHKGRLSVDSLQRQEANSPEAVVVAYLLTQRNNNAAPQTRDFTTFSPEVARVVVRRADEYLCLDGLTTLSPETAEALAQHTGTLQLNGLTDISIEAEIALAKHRNRFGSSGLELRGLTSLKTAELAEQLWPLNSYYSSNKLQYVSPDAIRSLTRQPWFTGSNSVSLDHLTELPPELAASLAECKGPLSLRGLTSLSAEAARELMRLRQIPEQYSYPSLSLNGLTTISPEVATELAKNPDYLSLVGITTLSDEAAEALSRHEGGMDLGVTALSDVAAEALAKTSGRLRLLRLNNASPRALAMLKARGLQLVMPLQMYSPLEQFTWGLTGWLQGLLLASLVVMIACVTRSFYLTRSLSRARELTLAVRRQAKRAALALLAASGLFSGWCVFLTTNVLRESRGVYANPRASWPPEEFFPLDWCLLGLLIAILAASAYTRYVYIKLKNTPALWGMTSLLPSNLSRGERVGKASGARVIAEYAVMFVVSGVLAGYAFMFVLFGGTVLIQIPHFWAYRELTIVRVCLTGFGLVPAFFGGLMLWGLWGLWSRNGRCFDAYSDHFKGTMRPVARKAWVIGQSVIPWSAVESFSWKPDHLELTVRPGRPHNRISEKWLVSGVVPPEQREAVHAFLSARLPGDSTPSAY